jgi:hypothetical protein
MSVVQLACCCFDPNLGCIALLQVTAVDIDPSKEAEAKKLGAEQ